MAGTPERMRLELIRAIRPGDTNDYDFSGPRQKALPGIIMPSAWIPSWAWSGKRCPLADTCQISKS